MAYEPGTFHVGFTEYTITCWVCGYQETDYQQAKWQAEKVFRVAGWHKKDGKWCCGSHQRLAARAIAESLAPATG